MRPSAQKVGKNICSIHNLELGPAQSLAGWNSLPPKGEGYPARPYSHPFPSLEVPLPETASHPRLCFDSEDGVQTEIAQTEAIETIRAFLQDPTRFFPSGMPSAIAFREVTYMGNSPSGVLRVARFEDERGTSYLVAVVAGKVLEIDPGAASPPSAGPALSRDELQTIAEDLIRREFPDFEAMREQLTFEAGAKSGGVNFFRWGLAAPTDDGSMPPLAQVGITESGEIFSYINTLYFLQ